ncbi:hypothetical protein BDD12DRAFT_896756 [Trichophaea hybrida]|nr:hypothetical protein BDD12DRAFT_896756 [Trichophaea hybrida]
MFRSVAAEASVPTEWRPKTHVSFRITLPASTHARTVDVLGSWDNYRTAIPLEQDRRVGQDVWKGILSQNGGLEMGTEHYYYFLLDQKHSIPDPQSSPASLAVDTRLGKLISVLYVPVELPPMPDVPPQQQTTANHTKTISETSISPTNAVGSSVFADFDHGGVAFEKPREVPVTDRIAKGGSSFRDRLRVRRSSTTVARIPPTDDHQHKTKRRRGWGLQLSASTAFLRKSYRSHDREYMSSDDEEMLPPPSTPRDENAIRDIAGYIRSTHHTPVSAYPIPSASEPSPGMYSSFYSSEDDDEISTPVDEPQAAQYPKYFNFDELKSGTATEELGCLRDQIAGEVKWRKEMESELGYLGSVVV